MMARVLLLSLAIVLGCAEPGVAASIEPSGWIASLAAEDLALDACLARIYGLERDPALAPTPLEPSARAALFGRAAGEPVVFLRPPRATPPEQLDEPARRSLASLARIAALARVQRLRARFGHDPTGLRKLVLREGYLYSDDAAEAHALVRTLALTDLFDSQDLYLMRGEHTHHLTRRRSGISRRWEYIHADGELAGTPAKLLFADRVADTLTALAHPLHLDLSAFRARAGFDRMLIGPVRQDQLVAELVFGATRVQALVLANGPRLELGCMAAPAAIRAEVDRHLLATASRRRALARLGVAIAHSVAEELPFDRPLGAKDHLSDGQLRPLWNDAYRTGRLFFAHEDQAYPVFDARGRPAPPQMCVEMIVDAYERAAGSWFLPAGDPRTRSRGSLDFRALGLGNRASVLAFESFASSRADMFVARRIPDADRIPFREREKFFGYFLDHASEFSAGDIIAIQGPKPDGYVHQHAILIADVDPLTGFPYALADQMKRPRRRTFEDIMAEAPKRSLLYHVRPRSALLERLDVDTHHRPSTTAD